MTTTPTVKGPAYLVETDRLIVRCWAPADALRLRAALDAADQHLRPWIPWMRDEPRSLEATAMWLRATRAKFDLDQDYRYGIFSSDGQVLLGETGLYTRAGHGAREIGYWLTPEAAGQGYAKEAAAAMVRVAFEVDSVDRVEIRCVPDNAPSAAIPAKLGFVHEATLRSRFVDSEGQVRDTMVWSLFADGYTQSPARVIRVQAFDGMGHRIL